MTLTAPSPASGRKREREKWISNQGDGETSKLITDF
jgi:hypothetical protein